VSEWETRFAIAACAKGQLRGTNCGTHDPNRQEDHTVLGVPRRFRLGWNTGGPVNRRNNQPLSLSWAHSPKVLFCLLEAFF